MAEPERGMADSRDFVQCGTGKVGYSTKERANRALSQCRSRGGAVIRVYRCRACRQFHLTSKRESEGVHAKVTIWRGI